MRSVRTKRTTSSESTTLMATWSTLAALATLALGGASVIVSTRRSECIGDVPLAHGRDRGRRTVRRDEGHVETQPILLGQRNPFGVGRCDGEGVEAARV